MEEDCNCMLECVVKYEVVFVVDVYFDVEVICQVLVIKVCCNGVQVKNVKMGDKVFKFGVLVFLML